jgi:uncharacterized protein YecE (DUF72 family)
VEPLRKLSEDAEEAYVLFNNNRWSPAPDDPGRTVAQAAQNAQMLMSLLEREGVRT